MSPRTPPASVECKTGKSPTNAAEMAGMRKRAWREQGVLMIPEDSHGLTWPERELVNQLGDKFYGKRKVT